MMHTKLKTALIALFILFFLLFNTPFLSIPNGSTGRLPNTMIYIGIFWIILISIMGMISSKEEKKD
ncbi:MAG: hypothetical protein AAFY41_00985 [Bacteroidota bacterium]